ncbi:hypothetical protein TNCV_3084841 [Trichonephila clavipes]|nr:hypothetical protein TNCV_3084841 [Trichonephila clavipes]
MFFSSKWGCGLVINTQTFCREYMRSLPEGGTGALKMRNCARTLILPRAPKPNRILSKPHKSYDMGAVNFLHHENLPTWTGVKHATLGVQGQRQTNYATHPATCKYSNTILIFFNPS